MATRFQNWARARRPRQANRTTRRFETLETRALLAAAPMITEFLASNKEVLNDGDRDSSDWIEISNQGDEALDLLG